MGSSKKIGLSHEMGLIDTPPLSWRFLRNFKARMLKLGIHVHMENELLYCGNENRTPCLFNFLYFIQ